MPVHVARFDEAWDRSRMKTIYSRVSQGSWLTRFMANSEDEEIEYPQTNYNQQTPTSAAAAFAASVQEEEQQVVDHVV